ncbi:MAG: ROK family protein [Gammaproteobacteria bacterium]|nr:ROK family protein [Gammaproteobacteria bacterium]
MNKLFAGIEAGGTKFVCAIGDSSGTILNREVIPTTVPDETMPLVIKYLQDNYAKTPFSAIGVASFGPVDPDPNSPTFGYITTTPKPGWTMFNLLGALKKHFQLPMGFDTDVNGAALGEYRWGAGQGLDSLIYYTIGTGIGAGGMLSGKMMHGMMHPEAGHMFIPHDKVADAFAGVCPFHGDCLEGLASGPSIMKRWQVKSALDLPPDHEAWDLEAKYLAYAMANTVMVLSPQKIILGGGVMKQQQLFPKIRQKTVEFLAGYIKHKNIIENIDDYIVPQGLPGDSGICGAIALAENAFNNL